MSMAVRVHCSEEAILDRKMIAWGGYTSALFAGSHHLTHPTGMCAAQKLSYARTSTMLMSASPLLRNCLWSQAGDTSGPNVDASTWTA